MLKCCISTRDMEIQIRPILSELFPESKTQSGTMHTEKAKPTWARSPVSVGNLTSVGVDDFTRKACMDLEARGISYAAHSAAGEKLLPLPRPARVLGSSCKTAEIGAHGVSEVLQRAERWLREGGMRRDGERCIAFVLCILPSVLLLLPRTS